MGFWLTEWADEWGRPASLFSRKWKGDIRLAGVGLALKVEKLAVLLYKIILGGVMEKEFTPVSIPTSLYKKIEEKIKGTEFSSVSSYVTKVLRESLSKNEENKEVFSAEEEEKIKERLKALGYID